MRARHFEILNEFHSKPNHISLDRTPTCDYSASKWPCNDQIDLTKVEIPVLAMGITSDLLYPAYQSRELVDVVNTTGGEAEYVELDSPHGHDAFLLEFDQVGEALTKFLHRVEHDV